MGHPEKKSNNNNNINCSCHILNTDKVPDTVLNAWHAKSIESNPHDNLTRSKVLLLAFVIQRNSDWRVCQWFSNLSAQVAGCPPRISDLVGLDCGPAPQNSHFYKSPYVAAADLKATLEKYWFWSLVQACTMSAWENEFSKLKIWLRYILFKYMYFFKFSNIKHFSQHLAVAFTKHSGLDSCLFALNVLFYDVLHGTKQLVIPSKGRISGTFVEGASSA